MRILAICAESPDNVHGGMGIHARNLYANMPLDVTYLTFDEGYRNDKRYKIVHPTAVTYLMPETKYEWLQENLRCMLVEAFRQIPGIDVIHAHDWNAVTTALAVREAYDVPIVTTFHLFQHHVQRVEGYNMSRQTYFMKRMEREGLELSDKIIVCSRHMDDYINSQFGIRRDVTLIPNATPPSAFHDFGDLSSLRKQFPDKPIVLYSGRWAMQKGVYELLEAVELTDEYFFVFMCRPPEGHPSMEAVNRVTKKYPDRVRFIGHKEGLERFQYYRIADYGIVPSLCEPFGIVALEFMACRVPLVTTAVDGLADFVNEDNSYVIQPTATGILRGLKMATRSKLDAGFETASRRTWHDVVNETIDVYKEVVPCTSS